MRSWISLFCVVAMSLSACGDEGTAKDGGPPGEAILDSRVPDTLAPDGPPGDGSVPPAEYKFVKIEDLSTVTGAQDGADIDAVELKKTGGSTWVASVVSCKLPDNTDCANPSKVVGASDAFCSGGFTQCFSNVELPTETLTDSGVAFVLEVTLHASLTSQLPSS